MKRYVALVGIGMLLAGVLTTAQTVTGSGTAGTVPVFSGTSSVTDSSIAVSGSSVGIGTTAPIGKVDIKLGTNQHVNFVGNVNGAFSGTPGILSINDANTAYTPMGFYAAQYFFGGGSVGIGTTSPGSLLEVNGTITSDVGASGSSILTHSDGNNPTLWIAAVGASNPNAQEWFRVNGPTYWTIGANYADNSNFEIAGPAQELGGSGSRLSITTAGYVGIGTTSPGYALDVVGAIHSSGGVKYPDGNTQTIAWTGVLCGGDYAEAMNASGGKRAYEPGDVLVLASDDKGDVQKSREPYSTMVAGIFATKPGVIGRRQNQVRDSDEVPMAMIGVVPTKVTVENGPIRRGDLLVTSSQAGYAMKGTDRGRMLGAVIGKAMGSLDSGTGVIEVLVTLQ